jgi:hypothetical protein
MTSYRVIFVLLVSSYARHTAYRHILNWKFRMAAIRGCIQNIPDWRYENQKKLNIKPIGRCHPRNSSLPHVDNGPVPPSPPFLERFLEVLFCHSVKHSLRFDLDLLNSIKSASFQLQFHFWKQEKVTGSQIKGVRWVGNDNHLVFRQKLLGKNWSVRRSIVMVKQPGLFSPKYGATSSHVFTQSTQNFALEPRIHSLACLDQCFALTQLMYRWRHQSGILWTPPRTYVKVVSKVKTEVFIR